MTCEKSVRPVFTVMPPIRKIEEFIAKPPRRVQIDTKQNPLQIVDNTRLFRQTRELNRTAVLQFRNRRDCLAVEFCSQTRGRASTVRSPSSIAPGIFLPATALPSSTAPAAPEAFAGGAVIGLLGGLMSLPAQNSGYPC
jgi:hypothetical protein